MKKEKTQKKSEKVCKVWEPYLQGELTVPEGPVNMPDIVQKIKKEEAVHTQDIAIMIEWDKAQKTDRDMVHRKKLHTAEELMMIIANMMDLCLNSERIKKTKKRPRMTVLKKRKPKKQKLKLLPL